MNYLEGFSKNTQIFNFINIISVEALFFDADVQTGMTKVMVAFRNFRNEPKNGLETDETCEQSEGGL